MLGQDPAQDITSFLLMFNHHACGLQKLIQPEMVYLYQLSSSGTAIFVPDSGHRFEYWEFKVEVWVAYVFSLFISNVTLGSHA